MNNKKLKRQYFKSQIGDVFEAKINEYKKKYFQFISFDKHQLNSDVIRIFKTSYDLDVYPNFHEIINDEVETYAHCILKFGLKLNLWKKIVNISDVGNLDNIIFCSADDYGLEVNPIPIRNSYNWYIWSLKEVDSTFVGKLEGENQKANIGIVFNPYDIIDLMNGIKLPKNYPGFDYESEN